MYVELKFQDCDIANPGLQRQVLVQLLGHIFASLEINTFVQFQFGGKIPHLGPQRGLRGSNHKIKSDRRLILH